MCNDETVSLKVDTKEKSNINYEKDSKDNIRVETKFTYLGLEIPNKMRQGN